VTVTKSKQFDGKQATAKLLIACPDQRGIIAAVAGFIAEHSGNIVEADQHSDPQENAFFMRVEIERDGFGLSPDSFPAQWQPLAQRFQMRWRMEWGDRAKRMAVMVSTESHCVSDLLWRWSSGELRVELPIVVSNHADLQELIVRSGVVFHHLPASAGAKDRQERQVLDLLDENQIDFVVLARYMQVLSPSFVAAYRDRIINIHHSFLPAFAGARSYHQAFDRGVKIIGATSHFVTEVLDDGPIIAQGTLPVDHRDSVEDLIRKGRDLERVVLATAVHQHVEDKILISGRKTVVFD
jgi:formyltetrahydrofolate deformylase